MGITKMLLTDKGVSLIILIVAITFVSFLGLGIASFMGAKQKSLVPQTQSYQAYTIAQAGIEFGIRYAYDNKDDSDFPGDHIPPSPNEKSVDFPSPGQGKFRISYRCTADPTSTVILTSIGEHQLAGITVATRTVELRDFHRYAGIDLGRFFCP